ncbi:uncharacterized protein AC631_00821 [Debaryomyces fabryi]|uniref:DUF155 domain-containing protein n=1 Tax=Debaryomyces fabryi TaxID=58627 RepID=A0A0V1Q4S4_9ASCO|nr:uncharacterized protein AC631_00821 [Debaryomyces fabryi]KSA03505.1 hypothetical protein AC631_00821 [Debaryomyces fabryi]CUM53590.1 unnamed protein product [Debaryomyces fabryi]
MSSRTDSSSLNGNQRPTAKRSPSILVTDARSTTLKGARAPFAGHNYKKQQQQQQKQQGYPPKQSLQQRLLPSRSNKYTDISVDKLLSNSSDIPSGQRRLPPVLSNNGRNVNSLGSSNRSMSPPPGQVQMPNMYMELGLLRKNMRSIPKLSQSLPSRTSKTSQKLVLIPDQQRYNSSPPPQPQAQQPLLSSSSSVTPDLQAQIQRSRAELMPKEARAHEFSRMTAYFICDQFNLIPVSNFLKENHEVKPRLYDEALYIPYSLPLLPGGDGFRVKSNNSAKLLPKKRYMEKLINRSEQTDHLYEYYSGVETPEDANNYSMDPELETFDSNAPFDPSEPQFFAPPLESEENESDGSGNSDKESKPNSSRPESPVRKINNNRDTQASNDDSDKSLHYSSAAQVELSKHHAEMFIFRYGIVVFWNFSEIHEKNILADLAFASDKPQPLLVNPIHEQDIETEEFHFEYDDQIHRPRIYNDMITLRSGDHLIKLTMSHAIAQLTKLCLFESRMVNSLQLISKLPKKLALTGRLGLKRQQLLKKSGKLFKLRVDVNLSSSILDTPDFFWSFEPALHPLYTGVREYLEIDQRVQVLNDRCKVFLEFLDIVSDSMNEKNTNRITWMIIVIIFMSLSVSVFEFILQII